MARFVFRRLLLILLAVSLVHFLGYAYAYTLRANNPFLSSGTASESLLQAYTAYLGQAFQSGLGEMPGAREPIVVALARAAGASLGLITIAFTLSLIAGIGLGLLAVRTDPPRVARWMTILSTTGLAMPSFYLGILVIVAMFAYVLWRGPGTLMPLPVGGFGWGRELVLPALALMARPTVQIARVTSGLLVAELEKQYVVAARSLGHPWRNIRRHIALRNIVAPVIQTIAGSFRLLLAELVIVEQMFFWPGLGRLLALSLILPRFTSGFSSASPFLNPPVLAALLAVLAALFLIADLVATLATRAADPRLRVAEKEAAHA